MVPGICARRIISSGDYVVEEGGISRPFFARLRQNALGRNGYGPKWLELFVHVRSGRSPLIASGRCVFSFRIFVYVLWVLRFFYGIYI